MLKYQIGLYVKKEKGEVAAFLYFERKENINKNEF